MLVGSSSSIGNRRLQHVREEGGKRRENRVEGEEGGTCGCLSPRGVAAAFLMMTLGEGLAGEAAAGVVEAGVPLVLSF